MQRKFESRAINLDSTTIDAALIFDIALFKDVEMKMDSDIVTVKYLFYIMSKAIYIHFTVFTEFVESISAKTVLLKE